MKTVIIDSCSLIYASAYAEHLAEAQFTFDQKIAEIKRNCQSDKIIGYTESPEAKAIFRFSVAVSKPYKSGRSSREKPEYLRDIKEYARNKYGFQWTVWCEAEDAMCIMANKMGIDNVIMAAIDKDVLQCPGLHYNYNKGEFQMITEDDGDYRLYHQCIHGDSVDSIPGCPRVGRVGATKALDGVPMGKRHLAMAKTYKESGMPYEYMLEQCRLVFILREIGKAFTPVSKEIWDNL